MRPVYFRLLHGMLLMVCLAGNAQKPISSADLKKLSVEELMNVRVTLVSRSPEFLSNAASAIQVVTGDEIRRSGATNLPDALRLLSNVHVAQFNSSAWIIGVRGFNTIFANKLLVMIDGRTVYTPLFGGVIWDLQNVLLDDIDRIEVVSGPGATLWGANAVNGVINIVRKKSSATQGRYVSASAGNYLTDNVEARYGGKLGRNGSYKIYGLHFDRKATTTPTGLKSADAWRMNQGGFRMDFTPTQQDEFTVQGDWYGGTRKTTPVYSPMNGQNILGRWTHTINKTSDLSLQVYYDRYFREDVPGTGSDKMNTVDVDFQHRFAVPKKQTVLWGFGYRYVHDYANFKTQGVAILPPKKNLDLVSGFIQDEISLSKKMRLTAGTKILHNVYTGIEWQPALRASYLLNQDQTLWAAVSRAVRTPSRFDRDYFLPAYYVPPPDPSVAGGPNFQSENLLAYEAGYRLKAGKVSMIALSAFYNVYTDVYTVEALPGTQTYQIMNGSNGKSKGFEVSAEYQPAKIWRIRGGYSYIDVDLRPKPGHTASSDYLSNDSKHRAVVQSILDLPWNLQFDVAGRYKSKLKHTLATAAVPGFFTYDVRIAWSVKNVELALVGENLAQEEHAEFDILRFRRAYYAKLTGRF